jgi:ATP-dependent Clp protease, protease subunit
MIKKNRIVMIEEDEKDEVTRSTSIEEKLIIKKEINKNEYIISIDKDIDEPHTYRSVFEVFDIAKPEDTVILNINSYGGYVHTMTQFFWHMLNCKAYIKGIVHTAYSAGAFITLCCDEIIPSPFAGMMLHSMSFGTWGKVEDVKGQSEFNSKQDKKIADIVFKGFLTKQEIDKLNAGTEYWFDKEEIDRRLKNWKPIKARNII